MIERFDFYDFYGYFFPGLALTALLWLPWGLTHHRLPPMEWLSAVVILALSYVAGHILHAVVDLIVPTTVDGKYPTQIAFEKFPPAMRDQIKATFERMLALRFDATEGAEMYCRSLLVKHKMALYVEQQQGRYAMWQGFLGAFAAGTVFHAGWALELARSEAPSGSGRVAELCLTAAVLLLVGAAVVLVAAYFRECAGGKPWKAMSWRLLLAVLLAGAAAAAGGLLALPAVGLETLLVLAAAVDLFLAVLSHSAFRQFTKNFASAVYRDFLSL